MSTSKRTIEEALAHSDRARLAQLTHPDAWGHAEESVQDGDPDVCCWCALSDLVLLADAYRASQAAHNWVAKGEYRDDAACHDIMCSYQPELDDALERLAASQAEVERLRCQHDADVILSGIGAPMHEHRFRRWTGTDKALCVCGATISPDEPSTTATIEEKA